MYINENNISIIAFLRYFHGHGWYLLIPDIGTLQSLSCSHIKHWWLNSFTELNMNSLVMPVPQIKITGFSEIALWNTLLSQECWTHGHQYTFSVRDMNVKRDPKWPDNLVSNVSNEKINLTVQRTNHKSYAH